MDLGGIGEHALWSCQKTRGLKIIQLTSDHSCLDTRDQI